MSVLDQILPTKKPAAYWATATAMTVAILTVLWPSEMLDTARFVGSAFLEVALLIAIGLIVSAWVMASGAASRAAGWFTGRPFRAVIVASGIGAVTPVCGVTVMPLMVGLLGAGVPLAPIMAFWLSSPITDPAMLSATWATLGPAYAIGRAVTAFGLGLLAGLAVWMVRNTKAVSDPLRPSAKVAAGCGECGPSGVRWAIWQEPERLRAFAGSMVSMTRLVVLCLTFAFAAEYWLRGLVPPEMLSQYVGAETALAIPLSVAIGAPLYLDGFVALPLVRGLVDLGMSPGAAMAFMIAGGACSIWGIMAVLPVLRVSMLALFCAVAVTGSLIAGYVFDWVYALL